MTLAELLALPIPAAAAVPDRGGVLVPQIVTLDPPVPVRALVDTTWSDGETAHPHVRAGEAGRILSAGWAGFITEFESGESRQIMRAELLREVEAI